MVTKSAKSLPMEDVVWPGCKNSCDLGPVGASVSPDVTTRVAGALLDETLSDHQSS